MLCITDESIELEISRTQPAAAQVSLLWTISGVGEHLPLRGFNQTSGLIMFEEVWISYYYNYEQTKLFRFAARKWPTKQ